jgi:hypothetical protein
MVMKVWVAFKLKCEWKEEIYCVKIWGRSFHIDEQVLRTFGGRGVAVSAQQREDGAAEAERRRASVVWDSLERWVGALATGRRTDLFWIQHKLPIGIKRYLFQLSCTDRQRGAEWKGDKFQSIPWCDCLGRPLASRLYPQILFLRTILDIGTVSPERVLIT